MTARDRSAAATASAPSRPARLLDHESVLRDLDHIATALCAILGTSDTLDEEESGAVSFLAGLAKERTRELTAALDGGVPT